MQESFREEGPVRYRLVEEDPRYRVGDDGSAWSRCGGQWKRLKPHPQKSQGHCTVDLGRWNTRFVHRLVLEAFVGPCPDGMECRHLDGDPGNNRLGNLCWGTRKENVADSIRHGTCFFHTAQGKALPRPGRPVGTGNLSDDQIAMIRTTVPIGRRSDIPRTIAEQLGVTTNYVRMIARGIRRSKTG